MAGPIQSVPVGLISQLGMKGQEAPKLLLDQVAGIIDLSQAYMLSTREAVIFGNVTAPAVGANSFSTNGTVPSGELWYVWNYINFASTGVGVSITLAPAIAKNNTTFQLANAVAVPASSRSGLVAPSPFWALGGDEFRVNVDAVGGGVPIVNGGVSITRLRI